MLKKLFVFALMLAGNQLFAQGMPDLPPARPAHWGNRPPAEQAPPPQAHPTDYTQAGAGLPSFMAVTTNPPSKKQAVAGFTEIVSENDVKNDANLFMVIFSPVCTHCEDEALMLGKNVDLFKKSNIVFICTKVYRQYLNNFLLITHNKDYYPKIRVGVDSTDYVKKTLLYDQMPQINIYNHERKLVRIFTGDTPIDSLKPYIE